MNSLFERRVLCWQRHFNEYVTNEKPDLSHVHKYTLVFKAVVQCFVDALWQRGQPRASWPLFGLLHPFLSAALFRDVPEMFNGIQVWSPAGPLQDIDRVDLKPLL